MDWAIAAEGRQHDLSLPHGKASFALALMPMLMRVSSASERAVWVDRVAATAGVDVEAVHDELHSALQRRLEKKRRASPASPTGAPERSSDTSLARNAV